MKRKLEPDEKIEDEVLLKEEDDRLINECISCREPLKITYYCGTINCPRGLFCIR